MAFLCKARSLIQQTLTKHINHEMSVSKPSILQAVRWMSQSKLFVGGISYQSDESSLREAFSKYGDVIEARIITDRDTGRSRGFGFITFSSSEEASAAIQALDGQDLHGRRIRVNYANDRVRGGGGYGGGYGGQGSYGGGGYGSQGGYGQSGFGGQGGFGGQSGFGDGGGSSYGGQGGYGDSYNQNYGGGSGGGNLSYGGGSGQDFGVAAGGGGYAGSGSPGYGYGDNNNQVEKNESNNFGGGGGGGDDSFNNDEDNDNFSQGDDYMDKRA